MPLKCPNVDRFCFVCGLYADLQHKRPFSQVLEAYLEYFGDNCSTPTGAWYTPDVVCVTCYVHLKQWKKDGTRAMAYRTPMIWLPRTTHNPEECYCCRTDTRYYKFSNRDHIKYANVDTVRVAVLRDSGEVAHQLRQMSVSDTGTSSEQQSSSASSVVLEEKPLPVRQTPRHFMSQSELNDLIRDLRLSKKSAEMMGSRMQQFHFLDDDVSTTAIRKPKDTLSCFDINADGKIAYCKDVDGLFQVLGHDHDPNEWRLFIDGSTESKMM